MKGRDKRGDKTGTLKAASPAEGHLEPGAPVKGAGGVVFNTRGQVLVLRHQEGTWVFPKGHIDPGETALEAAQREVEEESGVQTVYPRPLIRETTHYQNASGVRRAITWFLLKTQAQHPVLRETLFPEGGFYEVNEALERLSFSEDKRLLEQMRVHYQDALRGVPEGSKR